MRIVQPPGTLGSLQWMQKSVADRWSSLEAPILAAWPNARSLTWLSPLEEDQFAEYRDVAWLRRVGLPELVRSLPDFWPTRGPQWDALARTDAGGVVLVEAKAHIGEFCSPPSQASPVSFAKIAAALNSTAAALEVAETSQPEWLRHFYQYANRMAHLLWLRDQGVDAKLALVGFVHDDRMPGRTTREAWQAAYLIADRILGLPKRHRLSKHIIHVYPPVDAPGARSPSPGG